MGDPRTSEGIPESSVLAPFNDDMNASNGMHADLYGWWRIIATSQWVNEGLEDLGARCSLSPDARTDFGCIACSPT